MNHAAWEISVLNKRVVEKLIAELDEQPSKRTHWLVFMKPNVQANPPPAFGRSG